MTTCSKPGCSHIGAVVLAFDYAQRSVLLGDRAGDLSPHHYLMCLPCAERLTPPRGWTLEDHRMETRFFLNERPPSTIDFEPETEAPTRTIFYGSNL